MFRGSTKRRSAFPGGFLSHTRYIFLAGFPGAGKTTALAALASRFQEQGRRVALVTNDLGEVLVDTAALRAAGLAVEEVTAGSLAGRFASLQRALQRLEGAEIVLIEPVGCLADLPATVLEPLRLERGESGVLAPLSVLVEPRRAQAFLGASGEDARPLDYLFRRQLEEAAVIVLAQTDRLDEDALEVLRGKLAAAFPRARVLAVSARTARGMPEWLALLAGGAATTAPPGEIDHDRYAHAVAQLGWLDATIELTLAKTVSGTVLLESVGRHLQGALAGLELAHLKVALRTEDDPPETGLLQLAAGDEHPELLRRCDAPIEAAELLVNLRAETNPEKLHTALRAAMVEVTREFPRLITEFAHLHYFRPPQPR